ncbi:unnamed protein product [Schistosoma intercalatum]|nr:unnamed protein product [Schistosoma intercalatum]CAH8656129.1 unnamed protein product [Schistosoma intercalatum]
MNHSYNHSDLLTISSITINNDSRIDSETHTITQICFSLAFCSTLIHLIFILYFKRIRKLYGFCIMIHCLFYSISYLMTLITCSLSKKTNLIHIIFGYLADYCILTTIIMNLKSSLMIVYLLWNRRENMTCYHGNYQLCNSSNVCLNHIKKLCYIMGHIMVIILPILCIVISIFLFETNNYISEDHKEFAVISCNLTPNYGHFYIFFPILFILLLLQFSCILIIIKLLIGQQQNTNHYHDNITTLWKTTNISARFWITLKFTITHSLIWLIAFLALIQASTSIWHVFTLLYSLQAIYITVNCTFTRPVLDLIYQWREEKIDYYKNEHHLLLINHILNTNQQNDTKQDRINNILINY